MAYLREFASAAAGDDPAAQRVVLDKVISGEYPLALMTLSYHSTISAAQGAPMQWIKMPPMLSRCNTVSIAEGRATSERGASADRVPAVAVKARRSWPPTTTCPPIPRCRSRSRSCKPEHGKFAITMVTPEQARRRTAEMDCAV